MKFAQLDANRRVLRVVVCDSLEWLQQRLGGTWIETGDTTATIQGAGIGWYESQHCPRQYAAPWKQPVGAHDSYPTGQWVWHAGQVWENLTAANVWEPGISGWRDPLSEWPAWIQPTGSHDAYPLGAKVTHSGQRWVSTNAANVWAPGVFGWTAQA